MSETNLTPAWPQPMLDRGKTPARASTRPMWQIAPLAILLCSVLVIAPEARFNLGELAFPHYRITTMLMLAVVAPRLINGSVRYALSDLFIGLSVVWGFVAFMAYYGLGEGLVRATAVSIDTGGAYLIARASIRSMDDLRRLLVVVSPFLFLAGAVMAFESITRQPIWRPAFMSIFGPLQTFSEGRSAGTLAFMPEVRMGLQRAYGPFTHPILAGSILISPLPLILQSGIRGWPRICGIVAAPLAIFSVSSATLLSLIIAGGTAVLDYVMRLFRGVTWPVVIAFLTLAGTIVQAGSNGGLINVISRMTLTPQTAFYRQLIWEYGWASMLKHPWIGIGYTEHERPQWMSASIDAHFLGLGVRSGFPATVLLLLGMLSIMVLLGRKARQRDLTERKMYLAMNFSLAILLISSMTVTYFSEANIWFMAFLGLGTSIALVPGVKRQGSQ